MAQPRGRPFLPGNTAGRGRPRGSRNKVSLAAQELFSEHGDKVTKKCIYMALQGNSTAMRLTMERVLPTPKTLPVHFRLPKVTSLADLPDAGEAVLRAVAKGQLTVDQGDALLKMLSGYRELLVGADLEQRLAALEREQRKP